MKDRTMTDGSMKGQGHPGASDEVERHAQALIGGKSLLQTPLRLRSGDARLRVRSNSRALLERLASYFAAYLDPAGESSSPAQELVAIESAPPELPVAFVDWVREPGKPGRKDSYVDLHGARLVRKVRTGMVFLQRAEQPIAAGPCLANDNQVINFINAQFMNRLQQRGFLICHAAGLVRGERAVAIAGFSGGGKSTAMLTALENPGIDYLTNDRLFIRAEAGGVRAMGIPKLPRINPGTIVHSERLASLMPEAERRRLRALPPQDLWDLEQKYDVSIETLYGPGRVRDEASLCAVVILNWRREDAAPPCLERVDLGQRQDLLDALMKSPGPFYQDAAEAFISDRTPLSPEAYLEALATVPIYEVSGRVDFEALSGRHLPALMKAQA